MLKSFHFQLTKTKLCKREPFEDLRNIWCHTFVIHFNNIKLVIISHQYKTESAVIIKYVQQFPGVLINSFLYN